MSYHELTHFKQYAFIKGRYILESVLIAHELIHTIVRSDSQGVILKLDYEKAFDMVDLHFLGHLLKLRGFDSRWLDWMWKITHQWSVGVKLNNLESNYFLIGIGPRQGDPI